MLSTLKDQAFLHLKKTSLSCRGGGAQTVWQPWLLFFHGEDQPEPSGFIPSRGVKSATCLQLPTPTDSCPLCPPAPVAVDRVQEAVTWSRGAILALHLLAGWHQANYLTSLCTPVSLFFIRRQLSPCLRNKCTYVCNLAYCLAHSRYKKCSLSFTGERKLEEF